MEGLNRLVDICILNVKWWHLSHLHMHDSKPLSPLFTFFSTLIFLACVKGCDKATGHNKPSAQFTGASSETLTYDIVYCLCNQLLFWDTIAFHG